MQRPLVWVALALAGGIAAAWWLRPHPLALAAAVAVALAAACRARRQGRPGSAARYLLLAVLAGGALLLACAHSVGQGTVVRWLGQTVYLTGTVQEALQPGAAGSRFILRAESVRAPGTDGRVVVAGRVQVVIGGERDQSLRPGDRVVVAGRLQAPAAARYPGGYDEARALAQQGVFALLQAEGPPVDRGRGRCCLAARGALMLQERLVAGLKVALAPDQAGLLAGLALGARAELPAAVKEQFKRAGVYHLLVVSGAHVALVIAPVFWLLSRLPAGRRGAAAASLPLLLLYCLLTGAGTPVVRASTMAAVGLCALLLRRQSDPFQALAAAALVVLAPAPAALFAVGLQLSFAATLGILLLYQPAEAALGWLVSRWRPLAFVLPAWMRKGLAVTLAAELAVEPLAAYYFGAVAVITPVTNLVAGPLAAAVLPLALLTAILGALWPVAAPVAAAVLQPPLVLLQESVALLAAPTWAYVSVPNPPAWALVVYYAALALALAGRRRCQTAALWLWRRRSQYRPRRAAAVMAAAVLALGIALGLGPAMAAREPAVEAVSPGAVLLRLPDRSRVLVVGQGSDARAGQLAGALKQRGIRRVDAVVLAHPAAEPQVVQVLRGLRVNALVSALCGDWSSAALAREAAAHGVVGSALAAGAARPLTPATGGLPVQAELNCQAPGPRLRMTSGHLHVEFDRHGRPLTAAAPPAARLRLLAAW